MSDEGFGDTTADVDFNLQSASRAFHANRQKFCDGNVSVLDRLKFFLIEPFRRSRALQLGIGPFILRTYIELTLVSANICVRLLVQNQIHNGTIHGMMCCIT